MLSPSLIGRLAGKYGNLAGYKDSTQNVIHQQEVISAVSRDDFQCLQKALLPFILLASGGNGSCLTNIRYLPELIITSGEPLKVGIKKRAMAHQLAIMKVSGFKGLSVNNRI